MEGLKMSDIKEFPDKILLIKDNIIEDYWVLKNLTQCEDAEYIRKEIVDEMLNQAFLKSQKLRKKLSKLRELAGNMYHAAQYLTTDASKLHKTMEEYRQYVINELKEDRQ